MTIKQPISPKRASRFFRWQRLVLMGLVSLSLLSACNPGNGPQIISEQDEPNFRRGRQMERSGQNQIALEAFLKVIEKRGDEAPESHLEAGLIYLNHIKDPIAAIYHFRKYLELKPNSPQARQVEDLKKTARREFAATMPGRPFDAQLEVQDQLEKLTAENTALRAEITRLTRERAAQPAPPVRSVQNSNQLADANRENASSVQSVVPVAAEQVVPVDRAARTAPTSPDARRGSNQTYVIQPGDTLWKISEKVYGNGRRWQEIFDLNKDRIRSPADLVVGVELRMP